MLTCKHCHQQKSKDDFYKSSNSKCKECVKSTVRLNREQNIEKIREYDRNRDKQPHRVESRKTYIKTEAGKQARKKAMDAYHKRYPMKYAAHVITGNAIRDGKLIQASNCSACNSTEKIQGHHDDYTKPLEVRWLCRSCHLRLHRSFAS